MTFVSDQDVWSFGSATGYLHFKNGAKARIEADQIKWLQDRNGNRVSYEYESSNPFNYPLVKKITDSIGRQVSIFYNVVEGPPYGLCDKIVYKGFEAEDRIVRISKDSLHNALRTTQSSDSSTIKSIGQLFPDDPNDMVIINDPTVEYDPENVIKAVWLPNGQSYRFYYNVYGRLARVVVPTGGATEYDYEPSTLQGPGAPNAYVVNRLKEKRIYENGTALTSKTTFTYELTTQGYPPGESGWVATVQEFDAIAILQRKSKHFFRGGPNGDWGYVVPWWLGKEIKTESFAADGSTVLRRVEKDWRQRTPTWCYNNPHLSNPCGGDPPNTAPITNPFILETKTTLVDASLVSKVSALRPDGSYGFDDYNNQTDQYEYHFGSGTVGPLARHTRRTYLNSSNYTSNDVHILDLQTQISVFDALDVERARTTFEYDVHSGANHAALKDWSTIVGLPMMGHDAAFGVSYLTRGNVTATTRYLLSNNQVVGSIANYIQYDLAGNPVKTIDGGGNHITFDYTDRFGSGNGQARANDAPAELTAPSFKASYAFPTLVTNQLGQTTYSQFDYYLGQTVDQEDPNGIVSSVDYDDELDRPTQVRYAVNTTASNQTTFDYDDVGRIITTSSDLHVFNDNLIVQEVLYDQLGRTIETRQYEDVSNFIATQTQYDAVGRPSKTSNPFRPENETVVWTIRAFDALGRVISLKTTDNGIVTTAYSGNTVTVTDQAGKRRKSITDALGRLIEVYEDPKVPNGPAELNFQTAYTYDVLDNLLTVTQGSQTPRTFVYDSLKRLTSATNPESGTVNYQYDNNSNLLVKTDARGVSAHYEYDQLNRLTRRWYNGSSSVANTVHNNPALPAGVGISNESKFFYDSQALPSIPPGYERGSSLGRLVAEIYGSGSNGDYFSYDVLGRTTGKIQQTGTRNYEVTAIYNRAGAVTSIIYPSGRSISNSYDAAGRLVTFSGNLGDGTTMRTYSNEIIYSSFGALAKEKFGTDDAIYNKLFYNVRGQLAEIRTSTSYTGPNDDDANRGGLINHYSNLCPGICAGFSMTDNNGNLRKQEILIPGYDTRVQHYDYDSLNRLSSVREFIPIISTNEQWKQEFDYDRWGNRTIKNTTTTGLNKKQFTVDENTNRLGVPVGQSGVMEYDAAGNLKNDTYTGAGERKYDAENKITSAWGGNNQAQLYAYDASGHRIKRTVDGVETWQVYGIGGELLAEYPANSATPKKEYGYRNGQLLITAEPLTLPVNVASAANGATATASSSFSGFAASGAINGDRKGLYVWQNGYWSTASAGFPAWLEVQFNGSKTITEIDVFTLQDSYNAPVEPTESMTFSVGGLTGYQVQYWTGSAWAPVPTASVSGNNKVWKKFTFEPLTTTKIRVLASSSPDNYSRLTEVEAWTTPSPAPRYNLALASMGAVATASNSATSGYGPAGANNGDRKSLNWTNGGGWNDSGPPFPDWLQIDFGSVKTINEVDVFTLQDNWANSAEPTLSMTFTQWGLTGYEVQYWNGSSWIAIPGASVTANNKIWLNFEFSPIVTSKIRVLTNASVDGYSRITEVEAYGPADTGRSGGIHWLVNDHLGTPRMSFDQTGDLDKITRHDYLPFGEELFIGRGPEQGYQSDGVRQQFTSKERDNETGLDYFLARYYSSTQGRFTSPDEFKGGPDELFEGVDPHDPVFYADTAEPQSLNKYHYALNNPLKFVDPDGHQATLADRLKAGASSVGTTLLNTIEGAASAFAEDNGLGGTTGPQNKVGRALGHGLALAQAGAEIYGGLSLIAGGGAEAVVTSPACSTAVGCALPAVGVGAVVGGAALTAHGAVVGVNTLGNIFRGNSASSTKPQHGYEITDQSGDVKKVGVSGQPLYKNGTSPRANPQVNKENKGRPFSEWLKSQIKVKNVKSRKEILEWEKKQAEMRREQGHSMDMHKKP